MAEYHDLLWKIFVESILFALILQTVNSVESSSTVECSKL